MLRSLSIGLRKWDSAKDRRRVLGLFAEWRQLQESLPAPLPAAGKLLLIRLDDIGDYLLFRNQLPAYKTCARWSRHAITLLGNASWREIFEHLDRDTIDEVIWVEKNRYLQSAPYRREIWTRLRERQFETSIAPSRTRPLLLDDLCMLAAAPRRSIGCVNTYRHSEWNALSDPLYSELFRPTEAILHEFHFNAAFTQWACGVRLGLVRPAIDVNAVAPRTDGYLICFVGANTRSKRWPVSRWIEFIDLYRRQSAGEVILAGAGRSEVAMAHRIRHRTGARSIAGIAPLWETVRWTAGARAVVTNDTMAAHLGASFNRPTVIIANGVNHSRFTEYRSAGITGVETVYPEVFSRRRDRLGARTYDYTDAVSADIASIDPKAVLKKLDEALRTGNQSGESRECNPRSMS